MSVRFVLSDKARKDVVCRVPGLLREGKLAAADRCLAKYGAPQSSPLLLAYAIERHTVAGDAAAAEALFADRDGTLQPALGSGPDEVTQFFITLYAFHVGRRELAAADRVMDAGAAYGLDRDAYGLLWAKYCDLAGRIDEGLACLEAQLPARKRFDENELAFLRHRYPALAADPRYEPIVKAPVRDGQRHA
jgi:hypothetical protein